MENGERSPANSFFFELPGPRLTVERREFFGDTYHMKHELEHRKKASERFDRLITFADARCLVGLSRSKIYLLMADNDFPTPVKVGRNNYFSERELQAWIAMQLSGRSGVEQ